MQPTSHLVLQLLRKQLFIQGRGTFMPHENIRVYTGKEKITLEIIKISSFRHKDLVLIPFNFFSIWENFFSIAIASSDNADKNCFCNCFSKVLLIFSLPVTTYYGTFASLTEEQT